MRTFGMLLGSVLVALPALAQTPDTVAWRRYFPLAVGNEWEYAYLQDQPPYSGSNGYHFLWHERYAITERTVAGTDTLFTMLVYRRDSLSAQVRRDTLTVRYDTARATVVNHAYRSPAPFRFGCGLDADFGFAQRGSCTVWAWPRDTSYFHYEPRWPDKPGKLLESYTWGGMWIADIGMTRGSINCEGCGIFASTDAWTLRYAKVGGVEYGQQIVASEAAERPEAEALRLWPNPSRGAVTVEAAPRAEVVAFDLLGREAVRTSADADGRAVLTLVPGVYVVAAGRQRQTLVVR